MWASQAVLAGKNPSANAGNLRDAGSIPGSGRAFGGGHDNPLPYSFLENSVDRGDLRAVVHKVEKSWTGLKRLSMRDVSRKHSLNKQ